MSLVPMPPYPWFEDIWLNFVDRYKNNRMPHALLLTGPQGLGALALARAFSQLLLCKSPMDGIACHKCRPCQLQNSGTHPDLLVVTPQGTAKQIKIEQIRAITQFIANTAQQGGKKIIILSPVDTLNHNASNALLKSLEEPAGDTLLILITSKESQLLPTIKSRCARIILKTPDAPTARAWLLEQGYEEHLNLLAASANAPLSVIDWVAEGYTQQRTKMYSCLLDIAHKIIGPVRAASSLKGFEPIHLLDFILSQVDELLTLKMAAQSLRAQDIKASADKEGADFVDATGHINESTLFKYRERLCEQKKQLFANTNLNPTLFIEQLLMDWAAVSVHR